MKKNPLLLFVKLIIASVLLSAGILFSIIAFLPLTDDLGNAIEISMTGRILQVVFGLALVVGAVYLSAPILFKKVKD